MAATKDLFSDFADAGYAEVNEPIGEEIPDDVAPDDSGPVGPNILDEDTEFPRSGPPPKRRNSKIKTQMEFMYTGVGAMVMPFDMQVGQVIIQNADNCAEAWDALAKENPKVKKALESMMQASAWSMVISAHLPIMVMVGTKYVPYLRDNYNALYTNAQQNAENAA